MTKIKNLIIETEGKEHQWDEVDTFGFNPMGFLTVVANGRVVNISVDTVLSFEYDSQSGVDEDETDMTNVVRFN